MANITIQPGQTLSGIAQQFGTTVTALQSLNPQISNPNLIQAGAQLNVPQQANQQAAQQSTALQGGAQPQQPGVPPVVQTSDLAAQQVQQAEQFVQSIPQPQQLTPEQRKLRADQQLDIAASQSEQIFQGMNQQLTALRQGTLPLTAEDQAILASIEASRDRSIQAQKALNQRIEGGTAVLQGRLGTARFAPEIALGEMSARQQEGVDKINQIDLQAAGELAKARLAIRERNFEEIIRTGDALQSALRQKTQIFQQMRENAFSDEKFIFEKERDARDYALRLRMAEDQLKTSALQRSKIRQAMSIAAAEMKGYGSGALTDKQRQKLLSSKNAQKAGALIGVNAAMQQYQEQFKQYGGILSKKEKREAKAFLDIVLAPAISVAQGQGAMTDDEAARLLKNIGPSRGIFSTREKVTRNNIASAISGFDTLISNELAFVDSAIPGASDQFELFADYKSGSLFDEDASGYTEMSDDEFFSDAFSVGGSSSNQDFFSSFEF